MSDQQVADETSFLSYLIFLRCIISPLAVINHPFRISFKTIYTGLLKKFVNYPAIMDELRPWAFAAGKHTPASNRTAKLPSRAEVLGANEGKREN